MVAPAIIAGHSHTVCLGAPFFSEDGQPKIVPLAGGDPRFMAMAGSIDRDDLYWDFLARHGAGCKVIILWPGNQHWYGHLFAPSPAYDLFIQRLPQLSPPPGVLIIPESAMRAHAHFAPTLDGLRSVIERLQSAGCEPVLCGTPPPKGDNELLRQLITKERPVDFMNLTHSAGIDLQTIELSPPMLRFKLWTLLQVMVEELAIAMGCVFVPVPASTQTAEGFLRPEYWVADITHSNADYGKLVLDQLVDRLSLHH